MKEYALKRIVVLVVLFAFLGCRESVRLQYVYTRQTPAAGRKSPTTFVVQLRLDPATRTVVWVEDVHDREGKLGPRTFFTWKDCTFLDEANWQCTGVLDSDYKLVDQIDMRDGRLHRSYWGEERYFRAQRVVFGTVRF